MITPLTPPSPVPGIFRITTDTPERQGALFVRGALVEGLVMEDLGGGRVLIRIGNHPLTAQTDLSLGAGDKLLLRVTETGAQTVLQVVRDAYPEAATASRHLLLHRMAPQALRDLFALLPQALTAEEATAWPPEVADLAGRARDLLNSLVLSPQGPDAGSLVEDFARHLGLLLERGLFLALENQKDLRNLKRYEGLKGMIARLERALGDSAARGAEGAAEGKGTADLLGILNSSLSAIETQQVINVLAREGGSPYLLFLPAAFPGGVRLQELYVEGEGGNREGETDGSYRFVLFLDMDNLGEIMAEVTMRGDSLSCRLTCGDEEAGAFIAPFLTELRGGLEAAGLEAREVQLAVDTRLGQRRREYAEGHVINRGPAMSLYA
ncbi:MAG TPA: hypothetical protein PK836_02630 [Syntrophales bacterium]|nr:hypothetical protein [Syntrophales bacterium]HON99404.1 hypothetical protein [Syntrophales bacterium]HPC00559.1 hypothetical protein [Syntrophales bacterium]HPQ06428.1 hypothetical protein [Syntrophales bacterium]HRV42153.1 hypothetical protein [Syntrophales bacterium]